MPPNPNNQSPEKGDGIGKECCRTEKKKSVSSLVDELLSDIYGKAELKRKQTITTAAEWSWHESYQRNGGNPRFRSNLKQIEAKSWSKDIAMLREEIAALESLMAEESNNLVKYLKRKDYLLARREAHYDVITAVIHAISRKTRDDMKMKFSLTPGTETGFSQWLDAMKMVAQLPGGVPSEFRTKLWLQLSERHLSEQNIDWEKAEGIIFNEWTNPDDEELGVQIVKDLHRTGCSLFCGAQEQNQALLKRVLLAYARWNKNVGYCQGFNMLAALILQVMDRDEKNAIKVMIYLIEGVLPESYFANNLRGLSVDMAVFRDLLRLRLPKLSKHLEALQNDTNSGTSYEPPLTNVFTMQWFLTLFSNCLPQQTVLRVWDLVFLHGNEVLLRTALAIWGILQERIMSVESADEFYSIMGVVTREMLEFGLMDANNLIKMIIMVDPFPNELQELREKYLYNISPWTQSVQSAARKGIKLFYSDPEDQDDTEDEDKIALATAYGVFRRRGSREVQPMGPTLDISVLKQQYAKLRQRQQQAHIIISAACSSSIPANLSSVPTVSVNHLLMGKSALVNKGRRIGPPEGSIPPPKNRAVKGTDLGRYSAKEKVVISGETLNWKDAEKRRCSTTVSKKFSNTDGKVANNKPKTLESCNGLNREGHYGEEEEEDVGRKRRSSTSSASSTSTELCDDEFHRLSDFDSEEVNPGPASEDEIRTSAETPFEKYEEARKCAAELLRDIEKAVDSSERLTHLKTPENNVRKAEDGSDSPSTSIHDNIILKPPTPGDLKKEFLKTEPEVPIAGNVIDNVENRIFDRSKLERDEMKIKKERDRRKSDLALSVIKENLEMLSKYSQKSAVREESGVGNISGYEMRKEEAVIKRREEGKGSERDMVKLTGKPDDRIREELKMKKETLITEKVEKDVGMLKERMNVEEILPKSATEVKEKMQEENRPGREITAEKQEEGQRPERVREFRQKVNEGDRLKNEIIEGTRENRTEVLEEVRLKSEITGTKGEEDQPKEMKEIQENMHEEGQTRSKISEVKRGELLHRSVIEGIREGEMKGDATGGKEEGDIVKRLREVKQKLDDGDPTRIETVEGTREEDYSKRRRELQERDRLRKEIAGERQVEDPPVRVREIQDRMHEKDRPTSQFATRKKQEEEQARIEREHEGDLSRSRVTEGKWEDLPSSTVHEEEQLRKEVVGEDLPKRVREASHGEDRQESEMSRGKQQGDLPKRMREMQDRILEEDRPKSRGKREEEGIPNGKPDHYRKGEVSGDASQYETTSRVNKEVNTDITIATGLDASPQKKDHHADDFLISLISSKPERFPYHEGKDPCNSVRPFGRGDLVDRWKKESERIESKIELSKSDWDLKMKRIAELETTTREKLNEMKSKSIVHRHRSLDRFEGREKEKRKSPIPRIHIPSDDSEDVEWRKKKISALSFDEITSRTEKLLGANLSLESGHRKDTGRAYEYYSSPTSPEYRPRKRAEYSSPKRWKHSQPAEEDWLTITEENGRTAVDLVSPVAGFNPFPTRSHSRPKELGVRLGMYPPSPEGAHSSKKSH